MKDIYLDWIGFDWDSGNLEKSWLKRKVSPFECEQVFFNQPFIVANDVKHSQIEQRYFGLGRTDQDRYLFVVFTVRARKIRVISARAMNQKERKIYDT